MFVPTSHEVNASSSTSSSSSESPQLCRQFTFSEIRLATKNLDDSLVIGRGGFGKVYEGTISDGPNILTVAVKRLDSTSNQGASEFWAEVNMLSNLRHCHLVSLIGYCNDGQEMILVYEYMSDGTLGDHLHSHQTPLSWVQRLTICIGAARGLDYLHTGTGIKHGIVHRDVKSSNILLHNSLEAKMSDFGLSKICPKKQPSTYVNTVVKGTFGYLDPDYFYTGKLTRKSDVYAFGVVLFEVLCGKRAVDASIDDEQCALAVWAQDSIKRGRLKEIVDTNIKGRISPKCLKAFAQLAKRCLHKHPKHRPTMAEVVVGLEAIQTLQNKANGTLQPTGMQLFVRKALMTVLPSIYKNSIVKPVIGGQNQTLHRFDLDTINIATENFSEANRIPQPRTFYYLYKGTLQNGQGVAVSMIHFSSSFRYDCFMDEAPKLVMLQHVNLPKLLGYCIEETGVTFLIYEFPLHETLDCLIVDQVFNLLSWSNRYKIILGVAKALLYLHSDAPIRIIHGDVTAKNILLDENLNPVLSGFLNTRYLDVGETKRYLSKDNMSCNCLAPEYWPFGKSSPKADVYSLGVLVLITITGDCTFTLKDAQRMWLEGRLEKIIDPRIHANASSITRFIETGLLCVQSEAKDRPTMEEVVGMLLGSSSLARPMSEMRARMAEEYMQQ